MNRAIEIMISDKRDDKHEDLREIVRNAIMAGNTLRRGEYIVTDFINPDPEEQLREAFAYFVLAKYIESGYCEGVTMVIDNAVVIGVYSNLEEIVKNYTNHTIVHNQIPQTEHTWIKKLLTTFPKNRPHNNQHDKKCWNILTRTYDGY